MYSSKEYEFIVNDCRSRIKERLDRMENINSPPFDKEMIMFDITRIIEASMNYVKAAWTESEGENK